MRGSTPRRRPKKGGYARGDETRAQIVAAALAVFGRRGYVQASTREIATEAGVNPPALQYYFDGKDGLHIACAEFIIERSAALLTPALSGARTALESADRAQAVEALERLLDALTDILAAKGSEAWGRFAARGRAEDAGPGMELIRERVSIPMIDAVCGLVGLITGESSSGDVVRLRALMLLGQVHWLHASRDHALKVLRWPRLDAARMELIKQLVREHTLAVVAAAAAQGPNRR